MGSPPRLRPEDMMMRRPREKDFRRPDVVIGTRDWGMVERFLRDPESGETMRPRAACKWHVRIVLRDGERWHLNLLVSESTRRSRITLEAAANLGRGSKHDRETC
jgi:hypothetical protein